LGGDDDPLLEAAVHHHNFFFWGGAGRDDDGEILTGVLLKQFSMRTLPFFVMRAMICVYIYMPGTLPLDLSSRDRGGGGLLRCINRWIWMMTTIGVDDDYVSIQKAGNE
jgi:hypothetical protein